jgi:sugar lactone lactonase YvrE
MRDSYHVSLELPGEMKNSGHIVRVDPTAGIPAGEVAVDYSGLSREGVKNYGIWFGGERAHAVAATLQRALVLVPPLKRGGEVEMTFAGGERREADSKATRFIVGRKLAEDLHPVANPAFDPGDGSLFVTRSGARGEHVPVSLFRISADGEVNEFSGDITNPTGIAFDRNGEMFVSSRFDGIVYRVSPLKDVSAFATDLGIATGLAFNREGELFVGDRSGTIYRVNGIGEARPWAQVEPSVSAYHLAFGPNGALYLTGPTVSSFDGITRIDEDGEVSVFYRGLGRPQGLAFDREDNLYVAASLRGRRGIVRISPDAASAEVVVAGMNLVGLAFSAQGDMVVATNDTVYSLPLGIYGTLLD